MKKIFLAIFAFLYIVKSIEAQSFVDTVQVLLDSVRIEQKSLSAYKIKYFSIDDSLQTISLTLSDNFSRILFTEKIINDFKRRFLRYIPREKHRYEFLIYSAGDRLEEFVPNIYRKELPIDKNRMSRKHSRHRPIVENLSQRLLFSRGLEGKNIALWNSHGRYYNQRNSLWEWQRGNLLTTVEDKFTTQIVMNYLLPMLENSGAYVFLPRERDTQAIVFIADNDPSWTKRDISLSYKEFGDDFLADTLMGFSDDKQTYRDHENPFRQGTARMIKTHHKSTSRVEYLPKLSKSGWYSVSVSYASVEKSVDDAHYRVYHSAGHTDFHINQTMGGGTWIYLGTFYFDKGSADDYCKVVLFNDSRHSGRIVVADAVKFGGGMGNIARRPADKYTIEAIPDAEKRKAAKLLSKNPTKSYSTSQMAKFWEGSRYYLQWAGMPFDIYSHTWGLNDYTDDYASRGKWVCYLNNGSVKNPDSIGLCVPMDLSIAFHSDAGIDTSSVVGTLGIVTTLKDESTLFPNEQSRYASLDMASIILRQIKSDISTQFCYDWTIRGVNNSNYAESRMPDCPAMILECLSHQNFLDMSYGLNPNFQFALARAVYKGIVRFLSFQEGEKYEIQPLPVNSFSAEVLDKQSAQLSWRATLDTLEATAKPKSYIVYTRRTSIESPVEQGWDNGFVVYDTKAIVPIFADTIYSFRVKAVNDGGMSFPSETLSLCRLAKERGSALVVNGFTKLSAPKQVDAPNYKGFLPEEQYGVAYENDFSYVGVQTEFRVDREFKSNSSPGFGASNADFQSTFIKGNSFDYALLHGLALAQAGYSFSSASMKVLEEMSIDLSKYKLVDIILGKQCRQSNSFLGKTEYETIKSGVQKSITDYLKRGGCLLLTGSYIGRDLIGLGSKADRDFAENVLGVSWQDSVFLRDFSVSGLVDSRNCFSKIKNLSVCTTPNSSVYAVDRVEPLVPFSDQSQSILSADGRFSIGVSTSRIGRVISISLPLEALQSITHRKNIVEASLEFFFKAK